MTGLWCGAGALLERSVGYTLGTIAAVTPADLTRPTPCREWDVQDLLDHLNDSMEALHEGASGCVGPPMPFRPIPDSVAAFRHRAAQLVGAWADHDERESAAVAVSHLWLPAAVVAATGAIEIAVHGWDIGQACGLAHPIPDALAAKLLSTATVLVTADTRYPQFGEAIDVSPRASPSDRLIGFLGREPVGLIQSG